MPRRPNEQHREKKGLIQSGSQDQKLRLQKGTPIQRLLSLARQAQHEDALRDFLWIVNPDSDLTALPIVCENVLEIVSAAKAAWKKGYRSDWRLDDWGPALKWITQASTTLAKSVGGRFSAEFGENNRNPVMGAMEKHSVYGALCNSHPHQHRGDRFRLLQAHLLVARIVLHREHLQGSVGVMPVDEEPLQNLARPQEAARAVRRFSEDPLLKVIDALPVQLPPTRFVTSLSAITFKQKEAIRRLDSLRLFLEKAFRDRKQESFGRRGGGAGWSGRWIDGGRTDFNWRIIDLDADSESIQDQGGNSSGGQVTLRRTKRVTLTRTQMNDLLDVDDYPFEDEDEEEGCSAAHKGRAFAHEPGDFHAASSAWANHVEMANQMFPWSYGNLIPSELRPLLVDGPASLLLASTWDRSNFEKLELYALVQVMFWTSSSLERARDIRYLGFRGVPRDVDLALTAPKDSDLPHWRIRPNLPRCRRPQLLNTRGMDRLREDFLDLPDVASGSSLILQLIRLQQRPKAKLRGRVFRKAKQWYRKQLKALLAEVSSDPRLTQSAIANFMMQRIRLRAKGELTATAMITGRNIPLAKVRLFYACRSVKRLQEIYADEASSIRKQLEAEQMLHALILKETGTPAKVTPGIVPDETVTFRWFVEERYLPMREGTWSPAYRKINTFEIKHYLVEHFGRIPLNQLGTFEIQVWLNKLATKYSQSVVRHCYINIRSILQMAKKLKFLAADPAEDVTMPQTKPVEKPVMSQDQILKLIGGIQDLHDLCLIYIGIFCGPRASEVLGLQWKSWTGTTLVPHGTAFEGHFYPGRLKNQSSRAPIGVPEQVRPIIEAWKKMSPDSSPDALMFPTFGRGERKGKAVPRWGKNFLRWRVRPIAKRLEIPESLVTFQVMRRTLGTNLQHHGTLKDAQGALRHASIKTTGDVYVQTIETSVLNAMNSRTMEILEDWKPAILDGKVAAINSAAPKRRSVKVESQLDQLGPSTEGREVVSA